MNEGSMTCPHCGAEVGDEAGHKQHMREKHPDMSEGEGM